MKRIFGGLASYFMYFCLATVLAQIIMLGYLSTQASFTPEKIRRMAQVLYGIEEQPADSPIPSDLAEPDSESIAEVVEARAMKLRDMEFRKQALQGLKTDVDSQFRKLAKDSDNLQTAKTAFEDQLAQWDDAQRTDAVDAAVAVIAGMKAPQAKNEIQLAWDRGEKDWVVSLIKALPDANRKKIVAEFDDEQESQDLSEIIRLLREGVPETRLADEVESILSQAADRQ